MYMYQSQLRKHTCWQEVIIFLQILIIYKRTLKINPINKQGIYKSCSHSCKGKFLSDHITNSIIPLPLLFPTLVITIGMGIILYEYGYMKSIYNFIHCIIKMIFLLFLIKNVLQLILMYLKIIKISKFSLNLYINKKYATTTMCTLMHIHCFELNSFRYHCQNTLDFQLVR